MTNLTKESILQALSAIKHPEAERDIVSLGMISGVVIKGSNVGFAIEIDPHDAQKLEGLRRACEEHIRSLPGVTSCSAILTAEKPAPQRQQSAARGPNPPQAKPLLPDVRHIVAVASGKGGVGKSTTAINLCVAFSALGWRAGLLDADIYGPSMPRMAGIKGKPSSNPSGNLAPMQAHGIGVMSIGFLVEEDAPMIWRGPMVQNALQQLMGDVDWGSLDVLVVDLPPGTGDAQLTMAQRVPMSGAVIVSTPQDIALLDARKAINMFRKVNVPILGIVENMSYFSCPHCGHRTDIFAHGGAQSCAQDFDVPFLGEIPLELAIRQMSDAGTPIVASEPTSPHAAAYRQIAEDVMNSLETGNTAKPLPVIREI